MSQAMWKFRKLQKASDFNSKWWLSNSSSGTDETISILIFFCSRQTKSWFFEMKKYNSFANWHRNTNSLISFAWEKGVTIFHFLFLLPVKQSINSLFTSKTIFLKTAMESLQRFSRIINQYLLIIQSYIQIYLIYIWKYINVQYFM